MKEYGVKESWTVLFVIKGVSFRGSIVPLFYVGDQKNKVLVWVEKDRGDAIIGYDTGVDTHTDIINIEYLRFKERGIVYEETLVRPIGYGWEELDSRGEATYDVTTDSNDIMTYKRDERGFWSMVSRIEGYPRRAICLEDEEESEESGESVSDDECYGRWSSLEDYIENRMEKKIFRGRR